MNTNMKGGHGRAKSAVAEYIMIELAILFIILVIVVCIKINRVTKNLAAKERAVIEEHRMFHDTKGCRIYDVFKIAQTAIAVLGAAYIFICLATREIIGIHHLTTAKFWEIAGGSAVILLPKFFLSRFIFFKKQPEK